jgi:ribosomal protein S18 acetylase RimI-like enzyme
MSCAMSLLAGLTIREAVPGDEAALALLGGATMLETYAELVQGSDIVAHARHKHAQTVYADWIADAAARVWIAETATRAPAGYLVLIPATLPMESPRPGDLEVLRIYVLTRYQASGLGAALMQRAITAAASCDAGRIVLGVNKDNRKALAFYARQGFVEIGRRAFPVGNAVFDDLVLARRIAPAQK